MFRAAVVYTPSQGHPPLYSLKTVGGGWEGGGRAEQLTISHETRRDEWVARSAWSRERMHESLAEVAFAAACLARRHAARSIRPRPRGVVAFGAKELGRTLGLVGERETTPHTYHQGESRRPRRMNPPVSDAIFLSMPPTLATDLDETIGK